MSMISSQCNKLRDTAMRVEIFLEGSTDAIPMDTHKQLLDAADTILELRDDLQRANAAVQEAEHDESMAWDRVRKAEAENEKLRELCSALYEFAYDEYPDSAELNFADRMRKLRIDVEHD